MNDSILESIKALLGIYSDDTAFDNELVMHINNAIADLTNVGGVKNFAITDKTSTWGDFVSSESLAGHARQYIYTKVRLIFDPPSNSFIVTELEKAKDEAQWRFYFILDSEDTDDGTN